MCSSWSPLLLAAVSGAMMMLGVVLVVVLDAGRLRRCADLLDPPQPMDSAGVSPAVGWIRAPARGGPRDGRMLDGPFANTDGAYLYSVAKRVYHWWPNNLGEERTT